MTLYWPDCTSWVYWPKSLLDEAKMLHFPPASASCFSIASAVLCHLFSLYRLHWCPQCNLGSNVTSSSKALPLCFTDISWLPSLSLSDHSLSTPSTSRSFITSFDENFIITLHWDVRKTSVWSILCLQHLEGYLAQGNPWTLYQLYCQTHPECHSSSGAEEKNGWQSLNLAGLAKMLLTKDAYSKSPPFTEDWEC